MSLQNFIIGLAMLIFNLTLVCLLAELVVVANWAMVGARQRALSPTAALPNPYAPRLRRLTKWTSAGLVTSLLSGLYFWQAY